MGQSALEAASGAAGPNVERNQSEGLLNALQLEIESHRREERQQSYLAKGLDFLWRSDENSFARLTSLEEKVRTEHQNGAFGAVKKMRDEVYGSIKQDHSERNLQNNINFYGGTALKVGSLFMGGKVGWAATAGFYAADQARPGDDITKQLIDAGMGGVKGIAFKGLINGVVASDMALPLKGVSMSLGGRGLDTLLTSDNYYDKKTGGYSLLTGLKATGSELTNLEHLGVDAAVMGLTFGLGYGVNRAFGSSLANSPFYSRIATSGIAGVSRGAIAEMSAMRAAGETYEWRRIAGKAALMGGVYALAAVPGAIQADYAARDHQHDNKGDNSHHQQSGDQIQVQEYRKIGTVHAQQLKAPETWTTAKGETMQAAAGDWKLTGPDGSSWSVKPDIFQQTYSPVPGSSGEFAKTAITRAQKLTAPITIQTLEGTGSGVAGDYLVTGPKGEQYIVGGAKFESMYKPVSGSDSSS